MPNLISSHIRSNVVGYVALFLALGGVSYAAGLQANSVRSKHIANGQVRTGDIGTGHVRTADIADVGVGNADLAADSVDSAKVADSSLTTADIDDSTLTPAWSKLTGVPAGFADGVDNEGTGGGTATGLTCATPCVQTAEIADAAVTIPKLAFDPAEQTELNAHKTSADHDGRYFTETELSAPGAINAAGNPVDWTKLKGVPGGFADGADANSGGSVTSVGSGAGLAGGPITTAGALSILPSFRLPQSCVAGQVAKYNPTTAAWDCAADASGGPPSGPAGGDLTGIYPNPTIGAGKVTGSKIGLPLTLSGNTLGSVVSATNSSSTTGNSTALRGNATTGYGVHGETMSGFGTYGVATGFNGEGVRAEATGANGTGLVARALSSATWAAVFQGDVHVNGTLSKSAGAFRIDHPLDPENQYLQHSFVESPDMKNIYDGVATTGRRGFARIEMADWFSALNRSPRYQLTVHGRSFARAIVWRELRANQFVIRTDEPNTTVSWQVTGIRKDAYAKANRIDVEVPKEGSEDGR